MAEDLKENLFSPKCRVPERLAVVDLLFVQSAAPFGCLSYARPGRNHGTRVGLGLQ